MTTTMKKSSEQILQEMDLAAQTADKDLAQLSKPAVNMVGAWLKKHYRAAGYKRLAKLLIAKVQ